MTSDPSNICGTPVNILRFVIKDVMMIDCDIEKNYNDALFFAHSRTKAEDDLRKDVLECRLEIATSRIEQGRSRLEDYIYN